MKKKSDIESIKTIKWDQERTKNLKKKRDLERTKSSKMGSKSVRAPVTLSKK